MDNKDSGVLQFKKPEGVVPSSSYMDMIANAVSSGASIEALERLMNMKREYDKEEAKKAFNVALAKFQEECPEIRKSKKVEFDTKMGKASYHYAPLEDIHRQIKHLLVKYGFNRTWKHSYPGNGKTCVTCILSHIGGHSTETDMEVDADTSGSKNAIQGQRSAITFARRTTLEGALGIATADQDIDGRLPELDVDKLHQTYMDVFNKFPKDYPGIDAMNPENWKTEKTGKVYVGAIAAARKRYADLVKPD